MDPILGDSVLYQPEDGSDVRAAQVVRVHSPDETATPDTVDLVTFTPTYMEFVQGVGRSEQQSAGNWWWPSQG